MRYGLRVMANSPGFTAVAVFTLALGIAANATVFGWIDTILLHPLAGTMDPQSLVLLESVTSRGDVIGNVSFLDYRDYRDNLRMVSGLAVARTTPLTLGSGGRSERTWAELVSGNYFDVLGVKPLLGRTFLPEESENQAGAYPVVVISERMWRSRFRGDPKVLGEKLRVNRSVMTVVGVVPEEFRGSSVGLAYDVWMPITMATAMGTGTGTLNYRGTRDLTTLMARLRPGTTVEQLRAEAAAIAARLAAAYPRTNRGIGINATTIAWGHNAAQRLLAAPLRILMGVCVLLLLIVCANVANLLLARATSRNKEFGIRLALGSGSGRIVRQLLTETLLLAAAGGLAGTILAMWMSQSLASLLPPNDFPIYLDSGVNIRTLVFTIVVTLAATVISGIAPALMSMRSNVSETLKEGGRSDSGASGSRTLRNLLVVSEVALAAVVIIGAGLFLKSFRNASSIEPGFDISNTLVAQFYLSPAGYSAEEQRQFCRSLRQRLESNPEIISATYSDVIPLTFGTSPWHLMEVEGYIPAPGEDMNIHRSFIPPGYFHQMRIPLLEGRDFTEIDEAGKPPVIIVNQAFAGRYFGGANPVGRRVRMENSWTTVVGLAKDTKYHNLAELPMPFYYAPFRQRFAPGLNFAFFLKAIGDPTRASEVLRREALSLNPDAVFSATLFSQAVTACLYPQKVASSLLGALGIVSLILAAVGLYSVMSYTVTQRTHELGIRMALGARPASVLALVVGQGLTLAFCGLAAGAIAAAATAGLVSSMLVNVTRSDPATYVAALSFLTCVALLASYIPALRAIRLDPMKALRE